MKNATTTIARALKIIRTAHGITLRELSLKTGYTIDHLSRIENGNHQKYAISNQLLTAYATMFGTSPVSILKFAERLQDCKADSKITARRTELECMLECLRSNQ